MSRPRLSLLLLPVLLMMLAGADQQCVPVGDRVTAPGLSVSDAPGQSVSACVQVCNNIAKEERDAEQILHLANVAACGDDLECLDAEEARHEARMEEIALDMQICKSNCHEQGSGSGGQ